MTAQSELRNYWHPVAMSTAVADKPVGVTLLDEQIVLWRTPDGVVAFKDLCVHRGTKLSLGWLDNSCIVCPYHGWVYDAAGACVKVPSLPPDRPVPSKANLTPYKVTEKYGLVFVCLGEPRRPIIDFPEFDDERFNVYYVGPTEFNASAARSLENFIDDTHLAFVHDGLIGSRDNVQPTPRRTIEEKDGEFCYEVETMIANRANPSEKGLTKGVITYRVAPPFSMCNGNVFNGDRVYSTVFFTAPVSAKKTIRYLICARKYDFDKSPQPAIDFTLKIWEQDRPIVESQRPEQVPLEFTAELHLRDPDAPAVIYRRMLKEISPADAI